MGNLTREFITTGASAEAARLSASDHSGTAHAAAANGMNQVSRAPYVMLVLALIGIADAFYVAQASYTGQLLWCPIVEGCNAVVASPYARIFGVPLSYLGLVFYVYMLALAALLAFDPFSRGLRVGALLYTALGVSYSIYAMYVQLSFIRAVCIYCIFSGVATLLLLVAAFRHLRATRVIG
jgi:uncharacterized membrane protein